MDISESVKSGDGTTANVGIRMTGAFQCPDCIQRFDTDRARRLHQKFIHACDCDALDVLISDACGAVDEHALSADIQKRHITATIASSASRKGVTFYNIQVKHDEYNWHVQRRYTDFVQLDARLSSCGSLSLPKLPEKSGVKKVFNAGRFQQERIEGLDTYLQSVLAQIVPNTPAASYADAFFGAIEDASNASSSKYKTSSTTLDKSLVSQSSLRQLDASTRKHMHRGVMCLERFVAKCQRQVQARETPQHEQQPKVTVTKLETATHPAPAKKDTFAPTFKAYWDEACFSGAEWERFSEAHTGFADIITRCAQAASDKTKFMEVSEELFSALRSEILFFRKLQRPMSVLTKELGDVPAKIVVLDFILLVAASHRRNLGQVKELMMVLHGSEGWAAELQNHPDLVQMKKEVLAPMHGRK